MSDSFIRVTQRTEQLWTVVRGPDDVGILTFQLKAHAVAYGRALSYAGKLALFIDDQHGFAVKQEQSTLTYPRRLN